MNCKPGDLARFVGGGVNNDALLWVLDAIDCEPGEWRCETLQPTKEYKGRRLTKKRLPSGSIVWAEDLDLRPIRDPGDDAQDETLLWLPVPQVDEVAA